MLRALFHRRALTGCTRTLVGVVFTLFRRDSVAELARVKLLTRATCALRGRPSPCSPSAGPLVTAVGLSSSSSMQTPGPSLHLSFVLSVLSAHSSPCFGDGIGDVHRSDFRGAFLAPSSVVVVYSRLLSDQHFGLCPSNSCCLALLSF